MRLLAPILVICTMLGLLIQNSDACPPGRPCRKERDPGRLIEAIVFTYIHAVPGAPPRRFDRPRLVRLLAAATWTPLIEGATRAAHRPASAVRFVTPAMLRRKRAGEVAEAGERFVPIRSLQRRNGHTVVAIDGVAYKLTRCTDEEDRPSTCLHRVQP